MQRRSPGQGGEPVAAPEVHAGREVGRLVVADDHVVADAVQHAQHEADHDREPDEPEAAVVVRDCTGLRPWRG
jgi:hypothetical protein